MGKEARQRLARLGSPGFKNCRQGDTVRCLRQDLAHTKPTVGIARAVKFYGDVLASCPPFPPSTSLLPPPSFLGVRDSHNRSHLPHWCPVEGFTCSRHKFAKIHLFDSKVTNPANSESELAPPTPASP